MALRDYAAMPLPVSLALYSKKDVVNMKRLFLFVFVLTLASCGSTPVQFYDGPSKSSNETAIISLWTDATKIDKSFSPSKLKISSTTVNGKNLAINTDLSVLPGKYSYTAKCTLGEYTHVESFEIEAEANRNYAIIAVGNGYKCNFKKLSELVNNERFVEL